MSDTGSDTVSEPRPEEPEGALPARPRRSRGLFAELVVIVLGVLIALGLEGLRQWAADRALVREAHADIRREIMDNLAELDAVAADIEARDDALDDAVRFADELLERGFTDVDEISLGFDMAELSSASWESAERTGALAEMDYADVREYARIYEAQALLEEQQRRSLDRLATASAILHASGDPTRAAPEDLLAFREQVLGLRAELDLQQQFAERLQELYRAALAGGGATAPGGEGTEGAPGDAGGAPEADSTGEPDGAS
ncbi:MAG TPA: hypothetical protein VFQ22_09625 [Longimicrobiales bacterium]|nr:hypothetical protein [Longimicrobiales bacterium]